MKQLLVVLSSIFLIYSDANAATTQAGSSMSSILLLAAFFAIFYFLMIRPQMKRSKQLKKMVSELTKGDEVVTTGGIIGKIHKLGDNYTEIEIAEGTVIKVQKNAVGSVLPKGSVQSN